MQFTSLAFLLYFALVSVVVPNATAQAVPPENEIVRSKGYRSLELNASTELSESLASIVRELIRSRPSGELKEDEIAVSLVDMTDPANLRFASFRGEEKIYPASVVKAFYMAALYQQL